QGLGEVEETFAGTDRAAKAAKPFPEADRRIPERLFFFCLRAAIYAKIVHRTKRMDVRRMAFDFDRPVDRRGTLSYKWDQSEKLFGASDVLPLWVADMDFPSPPAVVEAIRRRAEEGIYGYTIRDEAYT